ncbi:dehydrogenase/reductase SDR family member 2, mitochondrial isoform X1 [Macaca fascicularis]|uniref:dehydrogenase/reductase SDR family member 2, mitochondrial isoform X1 n=1 Tax=Macaca fascicularis TaxID=9541 RepID=UPI0032B05579
MLPAVARGHRGWFHPCARLSVRMSSTGIDRKGILAERVAVVTGSTSGIGFAIARRLAQDGAHVVISSRKQQNVDRAAAQLQREGLSVAGIVCHVGKAEDRERLVATVRGQALEHCGGIDFLVCCAGVNPLVGSTLGTSEQIWDKILNVNVKSPALLLSQLLPYMEKRKGAVTLVSSVAAYFPRMELGVYNVSKTALLALTRTLALELAPKDIRVNCLVPGVIKTDFSKVDWGAGGLCRNRVLPVLSRCQLHHRGEHRSGRLLLSALRGVGVAVQLRSQAQEPEGVSR